MRIAYVVADRGIPVFGPKGASLHVRAMVEAFVALGHRVTLIVARRGGPERDIGADIVKVRPGPVDVGPVEDKVIRKEKSAMAVDEEIYRTLVRLHQETPFDFVYERYTLFGASAVRFQRRFGPPAVIEVNAPLVEEQRRFRRLHHLEAAHANETRVFKEAALVLAVSEGVRDYVIQRGGRHQAVRILPNAVDPERFHPAVEPAPLPWRDTGFTIGFSGSLKPWHGLDVLLDAFRMLAPTCPDHRLLIVGDGPLRPWIEGYACGAGLAKRIEVTGWLDGEALPRCVKAMDVAVAPYPPMEQFYFSPLKLYEYLALGVPTVASDLGQIGRLITDGENGLLVPPGDAVSLARAIRLLSQDAALRRRLGRAAPERVRDHTWDNNARRVIAWVDAWKRGRRLP